MQKLTPAGQQLIEQLAERHGFSTEAVMSMLASVIRGGGGMAQFSHPEFGGSGQWMRGGMTMVSDMFNHHLKARVDQLCLALSSLIAQQPGMMGSGSFQSQSQTHNAPPYEAGVDDGSSDAQHDSTGSPSLFVPAAPGASNDWWPAELGRPNSSGAQNDVRYAFFSEARRLAIEVNGKVTVYDTGDHRINGFSQQQSHGASLTFESQQGKVAVASLPVVAAGGVSHPASPTVRNEPASTHSGARGEPDTLATIEKLAQLHAKGVLSDDEYAAKKTELLSRL
ncbi:SHOCT domain-containing protein (plasmid) [Paraburkholderia sp. PREW-6R]|uniref:SHOCT domain-containing protein n=1 Tax=Paraburkholderia sp. PREW-6R TaxID=3141544 RepID=UPI0031F5A49E